MTKLIIYISIFLFILLFSLGFFIAPWLCVLSFIPLIIGAVVLFRYRYMGK